MTIQTVASPGALDVFLYGVIDEFYGISADEFAPIILAADKAGVATINLRIASRGGDVMTALAMHSAIAAVESARVVAHIDGIAASAASVVALAADEVVIGRHSYLMIHNPWGVAVGTAGDMRAAAMELDGISENIAVLYSECTGQKKQVVSEMMERETWMLGQEAVDLGFAHRVSDGEPAKIAAAPAEMKLFARYKNAPRAMIEDQMPGKTETEQNSNATAETVEPEASPAASDDSAPADGDAAPVVPAGPADAAPDASSPAEGAAEYPHAEVLDLCLLAGHAEMARGFFSEKTPIADVRSKLLDAKAAASARDEISAHHRPQNTVPNHGWGDIIAKAANNGAAR